MRFVVPSQDDISIYDRELLDDVMRYGSLKEIARQRHCCTETISKRLKHAFKHLETGIMTLEARVRAKQQRIDYLERQLETSKAIIKKQEQQLTDATCINRLLEIKLSDKQAGLDYSVESARQEVLRQAKEKRQRRSELQKNARIKNHFRYE